MTLEEKVGQVIQPTSASVTPEDMRRYHFGAILNGGNSAPGNDEFAPPAKWLALADAFHAASVDRSNGGAGIPSLWGTDAVHGHSNIVGATLFPQNIGLGAARDPALMEAIGAATAAEIRATASTGPSRQRWTVPQDTRWGRTYEGYSEDPQVVAAYAAAMVRGLQGKPGSAGFLHPPRVMATAKHFLGDGGTSTGRDQGDTRIDETALRDIHGAPYVPAIEAGLMSVMASYNSWNGREDARPSRRADRRAQGSHGLPGLHRRRTGMATGRCPAAAPPAARPRSMPGSTCTWRRTAGAACTTACWRRRRAARCRLQRLDDAVARILRGEIAHGTVRGRCAVAASRRGTLRNPGQRRAPRARAPRGARIAGAAEEQWRVAAAGAAAACAGNR